MHLHMLNWKYLLPLLTLWYCVLPAFSQTPKPAPRTENGWYMAPYGHLHILVVYAEIDFDSSYGRLDAVKNPEGTAFFYFQFADQDNGYLVRVSFRGCV